MRWELKAAIQRAVSWVPCHTRVYRWLQDTAGTYPLDMADIYGRKSLFLRRMIGQGLSLDGKTAVEVGTGWYPVLPILLYLLGAERVVTIDLNPWLTPRTLADTLAGVRGVLDRLADDFEMPADLVQDRFETAASRAETAADVRAALTSFGIEYWVPCDAGATGLPARSIDLIVSTNVLEHVPGPVIERILAESRRILTPGGLIAHHINPGDHFSNGDDRIHTAHFLRYSPRSWYFIGGSGVAYHNRLRGVDYVRLFRRAGLSLTHTYESIDERALADLRSEKARVHASFRGYSAEELACDIIGIFARTPQSEAPCHASPCESSNR